ncbi:hypothetical protein EDD18DRAFT_1162883 [Armillaria luteobubalina]|uniref:Secreted protein n=1 Tax=Armillaria luteobubalina TaxID=153913 RepID=A0AA39UU80_9AGAR|nr:hypothetical protein EDD18DRAFT_1218518 [Armillaria luteobubalina]KAK0497564.1 hypothetical protein EDD18DRAFT_1162883 [Armillaria luteobubalina]
MTCRTSVLNLSAVFVLLWQGAVSALLQDVFYPMSLRWECFCTSSPLLIAKECCVASTAVSICSDGSIHSLLKYRRKLGDPLPNFSPNFPVISSGQDSRS